MMPNAPKEIMALAEHQLEILERRFPSLEHSIHELGSNDCCLIVASNKYGLLQISFRSSSIEILPTRMIPLDNGGRIRNDMLKEAIILDYADPRFTDDTISDMIEKRDLVNGT